MIATKDIRIEKDFLGEKEVPSVAYYGVQTLRAVENFPNYRIPHSSVTHYGNGNCKKSGSTCEYRYRLLRLKISGKKLQKHAQEIIDGKWHDHFIVDPIQGGAGTSINMNTNEVIANRALELWEYEKGDYAHISPNTHVNMAQSTNDAFPTAIHISTLMMLRSTSYKRWKMHSVFNDKAKQFDHVIKMGRTHFQDAVPIRLGQEFEAYSRVLDRDIKRISQSRQHLYEVNMGATAVGTGLNANPTLY